jgi:hypothetical protein
VEDLDDLDEALCGGGVRFDGQSGGGALAPAVKQAGDQELTQGGGGGARLRGAICMVHNITEILHARTHGQREASRGQAGKPASGVPTKCTQDG